MKATRIATLVVAVLAVMVVSVPVGADWCYWEYHEYTETGNGYWEQFCYPQYYTVMDSQPDLGLYQSCDIFWMHSVNANGNVTYDKWYAYQWGDPSGMQPPSCCDSGPWCVVHHSNGTHSLSLIP